MSMHVRQINAFDLAPGMTYRAFGHAHKIGRIETTTVRGGHLSVVVHHADNDAISDRFYGTSLVEVEDHVRETTVQSGGRTFNIPDVWIAGFCQANRCHIEDAISWWMWQEDLEAQALAAVGES